MRKLIIAKDGVMAVILPDFGGMVAELSVDGAHVLRMRYENLGLANVLAGGVPVLFPFVSRCENDEAALRGGVYTMPMHGFAKDTAFTVARAWESGCEVRLEANAATREVYPYDFALSLRYEIEGRALKTTMRVENRDDAPLPFAAGYHPYFLTPDRAAATFTMGLRSYWDYLRLDADGHPAVCQRTGDVLLRDAYDAVFFDGDADAEICCPEMGYRARVVCGRDFPVLTICTTQDGASCVEPWQARPGAVQRPKECLWLQPGEAGEYVYAIEVEKL